MVQRVKIGEYFPSIKYIGWDGKYSVFWMNYYRVARRFMPRDFERHGLGAWAKKRCFLRSGSEEKTMVVAPVRER
jgi:hypothetical protein